MYLGLLEGASMQWLGAGRLAVAIRQLPRTCNIRLGQTGGVHMWATLEKSGLDPAPSMAQATHTICAICDYRQQEWQQQRHTSR
jgi:hypothetical protein